jgi:hypothetical protein
VNKKLVFILCFVFIGLAAGVAGAGEKAPLDFTAFDGQPVGARAISLGEAFAGLANDANAPYWNPAGLSLMKDNSFTVCSYLQRESNAKMDDIINADPLRGGKIAFISFAAKNGALSIRPLSKISNSTYTNVNGVETWTDTSINVNELMLTTAREYQENLYTGVSLNYFNSNLALAQRTKDATSDVTKVNADTGNGWSVDLGLIFAPSQYLTFGVSAINAFGYMYWSDFDKNRIPLTLKTGVAMSLPQKVTFTYDFDKIYYQGHDAVSTKHVGIEQVLLDMFLFRAGISGEDWNDPKKVAYTFGLGFNDNGYVLDVAMKKSVVQDSTNIERLESVMTYIISLSLPFGQQQ